MIVDESKWLVGSMGLALLACVALVCGSREPVPAERRVLAAMNLFFGVTIGTMAFGHLLAVTVKLATGTLVGSPLVFYAIGAALAAPSWWLIWETGSGLRAHRDRSTSTLILNAWLAITLLGLGLHNLPLAAPGIANIAYHRHRRRRVGWGIAALAVLINTGLFIGALFFLASGQSFEQFSGTD